MSSEYMRQILESIEMAQSLNEGYEDRVNAVAGIIRRDYPEGITKKEFASAVEKAGEEAGAVEMRKQSVTGLNQGNVGDSRKEFIKDVAAKIDFKRDTSTGDAKRERVEQALSKLATVIEDGVGNSFPDGDPFDYIAPRARKLGIQMDNLLAWLDRAAKKHLSAKSYHDYLDQIWDDYSIGNMGIDPGDDYMKPNPLTGNKPKSPEERWG